MSYVIEHHGIKGQRWGVIRSEEELARARGTWRDRASDRKIERDKEKTRRLQEKAKRVQIKADMAEAKAKAKAAKVKATAEQKKAKAAADTAVKRKPLSQISDEELRDANNRLRMEEDYKRFMSNRHKPSVAERLTKSLQDAAIKAISETTAAYGKKVVYDMLKMSAEKEKKGN